jgi:hypothetical protein
LAAVLVLIHVLLLEFPAEGDRVAKLQKTQAQEGLVQEAVVLAAIVEPEVTVAALMVAIMFT